MGANVESRVLVESHKDVLHGAKISLRGRDSKWVDVSSCVQGVTMKVKAGEPTFASIDVVLVDAARVEAQELDSEVLFAFAAALRLYGWKVSEPDSAS